ncbi:MAG: TetR/AcrR family transcriptional regulator [Burkholderiaceae bacterium]
MSARDRILKAAAEIAATEGVLSLGIDNVNRRAGVSKGAFFYHFKSKDEMVFALLDSVFNDFDQRMEARIQLGHPVLESMVDVALEEVRERGELIGSLVAAISIDASLAEKVRARSGCWHERAAEQSGLTDGSCALFQLLLDGLFMSTIMKGPQRTAEQYAQLRELILGAISAHQEARLSAH